MVPLELIYQITRFTFSAYIPLILFVLRSFGRVGGVGHVSPDRNCVDFKNLRTSLSARTR